MHLATRANTPDRLSGVPNQPRTPGRLIRVDSDLWERFGAAVSDAEPELDRSKVIREFIRWYLGDKRELPRRPGPRRSS